jgi:hypothetical protein
MPNTSRQALEEMGACEVVSDQPKTTNEDDLVLDMLCAMRPGVSRWVFADFMAGRSPQTPYLHVDAAEFGRIIAWILAEQNALQGFANRMERDFERQQGRADEE